MSSATDCPYDKVWTSQLLPSLKTHGKPSMMLEVWSHQYNHLFFSYSSFAIGVCSIYPTVHVLQHGGPILSYHFNSGYFLYDVVSQFRLLNRTS